AITTLSDLV
ncbi:Late transcription factor VLTF-4 (1), partial [Monkeypox virus]